MSGGSEYFQRLAWRICESVPQTGGARAIVITSSRRGEGKSYIAAGLAAALTEQSKQSVALCDFASAPRITIDQVVPSTSGRDLITSEHTDLPAMTPTEEARVVHVTFGRGEMSTLFQGSNVKRAIDFLCQRFGYVIVDGPLLADCGALSASTDGTLLVVNSERTRREIIKGGLQASPQVRQKILGAVLNKAPRYIPGWLYRRSL